MRTCATTASGTFIVHSHTRARTDHPRNTARRLG